MDDQPSTRQTIRRLYLYAISGISLAIMAIAAVNLLGLSLDVLFRSVTGHDWIQGGPDWERDRISLFLPLILISAPIWYFHWRLVRRDRSGPNRDDERRSRIRAVYLTAVLFASLFQFVTSSWWLVDATVGRWFGRTLEPFERDEIIGYLAMVSVVVAVWMYHWLTRDRDVREGPLLGIAASLPRAYCYLACAIGAVLLMLGASRIVEVAGKALVGSGESGRWWDDPLANGIAFAVTGGLVWGIHWSYSARLLPGEASWARSERESMLRRIYLIGILIITSVLTLVYVIDGFERAVWEVLDDAAASSSSELVREVLGPLVAAIPFVLFGFFHRMRLLTETRAYQSEAQAAETRRVYGYSLSLVGLLFTGLGLAALLWTINLWIGGIAASATLGMGGWQGQVALGTATAVSGAALWLWHWLQALQRLIGEPEAEQTSPSRRAYLFVVVGGSLVALIVSVAIVIYQLLQRALGVEGAGSLAEDISWPLAITLVAAAGAAYHGLLLLRDLQTRVEPAPPEHVPVPARLTVVFTGPEGADLPALVADLRGGLPQGFDLQPVNDESAAANGRESPPESRAAVTLSTSDSPTPANGAASA